MAPSLVLPLFVVTALAEILGCYLVYLWSRDARPAIYLVGAALALGVFAWLLSFHPNASRAYAAYGGVYVACSLAWGRFVEQHTPDRWDVIGVLVCVLGTAIIVLGPRS